MRAVAIVLSLSICGMAFLMASAIASVMDGKGSPGSYRGYNAKEKAFERLKKKEAGKRTCSSYANICRMDTNNAPTCQTRYLQCMNTGIYVGGRVTYSGMVRQ
jgi:hypothetical protein